MKEKKPLYKKIWFWIVVVLIIGVGFGQGVNDKKEKELKEVSSTKTETSNKEDTKVEIIELSSNTFSQYGKIIILNEKSDMPAEKITYKVPSGKYIATTNAEKVASFGIIKDNIVLTGNEKYLEELDYVSEMFNLTAKPENYNEKLAKGEVIIEIKNDESIVVPNGDTIFVEKIVE